MLIIVLVLLAVVLLGSAPVLALVPAVAAVVLEVRDQRAERFGAVD